VTVRPIRLVVVDDQPLFAAGMQMLIEAQPDLACVGVAENGRDAVDLIERERPDLALMDLRMPVMNGIQATQRLLDPHAGVPGVSVVVLTTIQRDEAVYHALHAGAAGFLTKDATPDVVLGTIRSVYFEQASPSDRAAMEIVHEFGPIPPASVAAPLHSRLSARERDVLLLVAQGLSNSEVATSAYLSEATVKSHVRAILTKLDLRSRVQIVIYAYENGLVAPPTRCEEDVRNNR
jgi:DNA-binding NarL/FixJ family response regulator